MKSELMLRHSFYLLDSNVGNLKSSVRNVKDNSIRYRDKKRIHPVHIEFTELWHQISGVNFRFLNLLIYLLFVCLLAVPATLVENEI
jgi:hypothetical protein